MIMQIFFLLFLYHGEAIEIDPKCTGENGEPISGHPFAKPEDCYHYYHCGSGVLHTVPCNTGTVFNPILKFCDWPHNVPGCSTEDCPPIPSVRGGNYTCTAGTEVGSTCVFECYEGFSYHDECVITNTCIDIGDGESMWKMIWNYCTACEGYTYRATTTQGTFDEVRKECNKMGGDLLQSNIGPEGTQYHSEIHKLAMEYTTEIGTAGLWIGYLAREGTWRFINGEAYDASNNGQPAVAYWGEDGSSGSSLESSGFGSIQYCAKLWRGNGPLEIEPEDCDYVYYKGLCEIKTSTCK